jgi:hypothetical protein
MRCPKETRHDAHVGAIATCLIHDPEEVQTIEHVRQELGYPQDEGSYYVDAAFCAAGAFEDTASYFIPEAN